VYSARYAGEPKSDARNNAKLVEALQGIADRRAFYYCVLVFLTHADDPHPLIAEGEWWGEIVDTARGSGGFGYDPHFFLPDRGVTSAELPHAEKSHLSHRGIAMRTLADMLRRSSRRA
jgi:XTP/dITP diphosphohydrolase